MRSEGGTIVVAMSGGVDSAVVAYLLKKDYSFKWRHIVGATHYIWPNSKCCSIDVLSRARAVCDKLNIPYFVIDLHEDFRRIVVDNFIDTYLNGKTPNPCVICNQRIRFDLFYEGVRDVLSKEDFNIDNSMFYMATGHYVRVVEIEGRLFLKKAKDRAKDQSYMLYRLPKRMLRHVVFPLGEYTKSEVYDISRDLGMDFVSVGESQDVCFVSGSYVDFIEDMRGTKLSRKGVIKTVDGKIIGEHNGFLNYTIGQRRGLGLGNGPWYVYEIDSESNTVIVARRYEAGRDSFYVTDTNWFAEPVRGMAKGGKRWFWKDGILECEVKVRYQSKAIPCVVEVVDYGRDIFKVKMERREFVTPGQSAVFYIDDIVVGGGIIRK